MPTFIDSSRQFAVFLTEYALKKKIKLALHAGALFALTKILEGDDHDYWYFVLGMAHLKAMNLEDCISYDVDEERWFASVELVSQRGPFKGVVMGLMIPPFDPDWLDHLS